MALSYEKLEKKMKERNITWKDIEKGTMLPESVMKRIGRNAPLSMNEQV